jgi:hypothetical protein
MISFSKAKDETPAHVEKVKAWVEHWLITTKINDDLTTVMVSQIKCTEEGCSPIETVVSLLQPNDNNNLSGKICKPIKDVTHKETIELLDTLYTK